MAIHKPGCDKDVSCTQSVIQKSKCLSAPTRVRDRRLASALSFVAHVSPASSWLGAMTRMIPSSCIVPRRGVCFCWLCDDCHFVSWVCSFVSRFISGRAVEVLSPYSHNNLLHSKQYSAERVTLTGTLFMFPFRPQGPAAGETPMLFNMRR